MQCQSCRSFHLARVSGKTSDMFNFSLTRTGQEYHGEPFKESGIGSGDYIEFTYCLNCGQIQGSFPLPLFED